MNWRKWNRVIHRDLGYFFTGVTIIYAISGIALNHLDDWNPNYSVDYYEFTTEIPKTKKEVTEKMIFNLLEDLEEKENYKKYYFPNEQKLKVFLEEGNLVLDLNKGIGAVEKLKKRSFFYEANYLHYNPQYWWTWYSDIYAGSLILIVISGLFIARGKNGITGRGAWFTAIGVLIPLLFLYFLRH